MNDNRESQSLLHVKSATIQWHLHTCRCARRRTHGTHMRPVNLDHNFIFYWILNVPDFSASPQLQSLLASTFCNNWLSHFGSWSISVKVTFYNTYESNTNFSNCSQSAYGKVVINITYHLPQARSAPHRLYVHIFKPCGRPCIHVLHL